MPMTLIANTYMIHTAPTPTIMAAPECALRAWELPTGVITRPTVSDNARGLVSATLSSTDTSHPRGHCVGSVIKRTLSDWECLLTIFLISALCPSWL